MIPRRGRHCAGRQTAGDDHPGRGRRSNQRRTTEGPRADVTAVPGAYKALCGAGGLRPGKADAMAWNGKRDVGFGDSDARSARYVRNSSMTTRPSQQRAASEGAGQQPAEKQVQGAVRARDEAPGQVPHELEVAARLTVQVFDGQEWMAEAPVQNGHVGSPFQPDRPSRRWASGDLEGPLVDYVAKGTKVASRGLEQVEGKDEIQVEAEDEERRGAARMDRRAEILDVKSGHPAPDGRQDAVGVGWSPTRRLRSCRV